MNSYLEFYDLRITANLAHSISTKAHLIRWPRTVYCPSQPACKLWLSLCSLEWEQKFTVGYASQCTIAYRQLLSEGRLQDTTESPVYSERLILLFL